MPPMPPSPYCQPLTINHQLLRPPRCGAVRPLLPRLPAAATAVAARCGRPGGSHAERLDFVCPQAAQAAGVGCHGRIHLLR